MNKKLLEVLQSANVTLSFQYADIFVSKPITSIKIIKINGEESPIGVALEIGLASSLHIYFDEVILFEKLEPDYHSNTLKLRYRLYLEDSLKRQIYKFILYASE